MPTAGTDTRLAFGVHRLAPGRGRRSAIITVSHRKGFPMPLDWAPLVDLIRRHQTSLLMTHVRPDADGLGAQLALADALRRIGKTPRVAIASKLPPRYAVPRPGPHGDRGLPAARRRLQRRATRSSCSTPAPGTSSATSARSCRRSNVPEGGDRPPPHAGRPRRAAVRGHHRRGDRPAGLRDHPARSARRSRRRRRTTCSWRWPLDTGWFRHPNTTAATFALAAELVRRRGRTRRRCTSSCYECAPLARLKLIGVALDRLQVRAGGKVAFTEVYLTRLRRDRGRARATPRT